MGEFRTKARTSAQIRERNKLKGRFKIKKRKGGGMCRLRGEDSRTLSTMQSAAIKSGKELSPSQNRGKANVRKFEEGAQIQLQRGLQAKLEVISWCEASGKMKCASIRGGWGGGGVGVVWGGGEAPRELNKKTEDDERKGRTHEGKKKRKSAPQGLKIKKTKTRRKATVEVFNWDNQEVKFAANVQEMGKE